MNGGLTLQDLQKMTKKKFTFFMERLLKQKKDENAQLEKANRSYSAPSTTGRMKYLGRG